MPELILYLLKANVALALFYLTYYLVLRRLTFYHLNRFFLVLGIVFSAIYPLIDLNELFNSHKELAAVQNYAVVIPAYTLTATPEQATTFDYWLIPVTLFWAGSAFMFARLLMQFLSLYKIHRTSEPDTYQGVAFRKVNGISEAFSFWKTIYLNPTQHRTPELESILKHEQIHVHGLHTLDVLLAEISTVFYWFNPGAWLIKNAMKENLEFIADQHVVNAGADKREYQYLLLKVVGATQPQIANQFNFPSLKRRIAMMNKMPTSKVNRLRLLVVLPLIAVLLLAFKSIDINKTEDYTKVGPAIYIKTAPTFTTACWTAPNTLTITPIVGNVDVYQLDNEQDIAKAYKQYGLYLPDNELYDKVLATIPGAANEKKPQVIDEYKDFYKRNPQVRKLEWTTTNQIIIRLESTEEIYDLDDKASRAAAEKKYGKLPTSPPPAQAVTEAELKKRSEDVSQKTFIPEEIDYYKDRNNLPVEYTNFLKRNPSVKKIGWTMHEQKGEQIVLFMKAGETETYELNDAKSMATAKSKYGTLPNLLPPPPPVMIKKN